MRSYKHIITVLVISTALASVQTAYGMKEGIKSFFGRGKSKDVEISEPRGGLQSRTDETIRNFGPQMSRKIQEEKNKYPARGDESQEIRRDSRSKALGILGTSETAVKKDATARQDAQIESEKRRQREIIGRDNMERNLYDSGLTTKKPAPREILISEPIGGWKKKETPSEIQRVIDRKQQTPKLSVTFQESEKQEPAAKNLAELRTNLDTMAQQMSETRRKIREEEAKKPVDQDQKLLKQLNLEKKKLGDKASSMQQSVRNIEKRNQLDALDTPALSTKVDQLRAERENAQKALLSAEDASKLLEKNIDAARKKLSSRNQKKYDDLAEQYTSIRDKLGDKNLKLPQAEIDALTAERNNIKNQIKKISKSISDNHEALVNHEATLVTARVEVKRTTNEEKVAQTVLQARRDAEEAAKAEPLSKSKADTQVQQPIQRPKKSISFEDPAPSNPQADKKLSTDEKTAALRLSTQQKLETRLQDEKLSENERRNLEIRLQAIKKGQEKKSIQSSEVFSPEPLEK